ncbi:MAG: hypothetical protein JXA36_00600 [Coriobacteriia bacterium]|nr:hypothetical protein [Coriobacteriia bacterium]
MRRTVWCAAAIAVVVCALALGGCDLLAVGSGGETGEVAPPPDEQVEDQNEVGGDEGMMTGGSLVNPGFEDGLDGWRVYDEKPTRSPGNNVIETTPWEARGGDVLHIARTSEADGGGAGVEQAIAMDVTGVKDLRVVYVGYVNYEDGGNIGGGDPQWYPEGGAQVRVFYTDEDGVKQEWYHGMCMVPTGALDPNFQQVPDNEWTRFESENLMELDPKPASIDNIRFHGFGWGFDAMFDDCNLMIAEFE